MIAFSDQKNSEYEKATTKATMSAFFEEKVKTPVVKLLKSGGVWYV